MTVQPVGPETSKPKTPRTVTFAVTERDYELTERIAAYLGVNRSEALRTAVRYFAAHIGYLEQRD